MVFNIKRVFVAMICAVFILGFSMATKVTAQDEEGRTKVIQNPEIMITIDVLTNKTVIKRIGDGKGYERPGSIDHCNADVIIKRLDDATCTCYDIDIGSGNILTFCFGDTCP